MYAVTYALCWISIHAPRVGSDLKVFRAVLLHAISIHAPRVGSDAFPHPHFPRIYRFLSTLPAWGATLPGISSVLRWKNFYPRSPRGERPLRSGLF